MKKHQIVLTGWSWFACKEMVNDDRCEEKTVIDAIKIDDKKGGHTEFDKLMHIGSCEKCKNRWNMWYMAQMKK
ncbi:MAG: hypothetical protein SPL03_09895 [Succinivibrio dextrinosolvens]|nr:hypothetical protein [Succinivibrio dextrinosolvens]